jgi:hypothetical protein
MSAIPPHLIALLSEYDNISLLVMFVKHLLVKMPMVIVGFCHPMNRLCSDWKKEYMLST